MKPLQIKICGMKHNTAEIAALQPHYLGFIFYDKSPRNFEGDMVSIPKEIKKVGVFVDATIKTIIDKVSCYSLDVIQLHGDESALFCHQLQKTLQEKSITKHIEIWKVFSIWDSFDFRNLGPYEPYTEAYLFDTKGTQKGGNGVAFNWNLLQDYPSKKPFILSGGISLAHTTEIQELAATKLPIMAIDVNSAFEIKTGVKDVLKLKTLIDQLSINPRERNI